MAITFRDFFIGLSEQAPVVAQLVHDYTIWNYQKGMAERKMALEEDIGSAEIKQRRDIGEYYLNEADIARSKEKRDNDLFPIELHTAELEQDTARMANDMMKATKAANVELFGGDKEAAMKKIQMDYEERQKKIDQLDAEINQAKQTGDYYRTSKSIALAEAKRDQFKLINDVTSYMKSVAADPEEAKKLESIFSRVYNPQTGEIDDAKFYEEIQQIKTLPVWQQNALAGIVETSVKMAYAHDSMIDEQAATAEMNLYSTDPKTKEAAHSVFGYKVGKLDLTKPDEVRTAVDNWIKYQKNQPKMKKYRSFISYITSSMEGMNIPLPGYDEEENYGEEGMNLLKSTIKPKESKKEKQRTSFDETQATLAERFAGTAKKPTSLYKDIYNVGKDIMTPYPPGQIELPNKNKLKTTIPNY